MEDTFIETLENYFLLHHILSPTRCRGNTTPHILDLVISNEEDMVSEIKHLAPLGSSDHQVISFKYSCYADWSKSQHKFNYGNGDFVGARLYLDEHPMRVDGGVDSMWESFKKSVIEVCDRHIPLMRIGTRKWKSEYPADMGIMQLIMVKTKRHREWLAYQFTSRGPELRVLYNRARNQVRKTTRILKRQHKLKITNYANSNSKAYWVYSRAHLKTKSGVAPLLGDPSDPSSIKHNDIDKEDVLQHQFCRVFTREPEGDITIIEPHTAEMMAAVEVTQDMVLKRLMK